MKRDVLLITGATGKSGCHFLEVLANNNYQGKIRCLVRSKSNTTNIDKLNLDIEKVVVEISDPKTLGNAFEEVDILFHIAGIHYSKSVVIEAIKAGVKNIVTVHTTGIFSKYKSAGEDYRAIESELQQEILKNNVKYIILRPTMIYGNLNDKNICKFIKMVDTLKVMPIVNNGKYYMQPVNFEDLGIAYFQVLEKFDNLNKSEYILSGKNKIYFIDLLKEIEMQLNISKRYYFKVPYIFAYTLSYILYIFTFTKIDYREKVKRLCEHRNFDHVDATMEFKYSPKNFKDGVSTEINDYLKENR